ncbi:hypothetical protein CYMTET_3778 [Cymbomonas tetramitiformis]|uniref:FAD-binding FR-type domain-containing protein n=1 Tax=Cymbomonas tetramitiformis TaxID=36881 RepID=A0AAE0H2T4_9CHLO|nr:hypothetical protein CYMTET_3778 [Cymbomonas tetramitiformis]
MISPLNPRFRPSRSIPKSTDAHLVYPSVEYDFVPNVLHATEGDYIHVQWTGSDANSNGNAGEGRRMTDRSNFVEVKGINQNIPKPLEDHTLLVDDKGEPDLEVIERFSYLGQSQSQGGECDLDTNDQNSIDNCKVLNLAPAYYDGGLVKLQKAGTHHYMSTRNNNFSNRSQKGTLIISKRTKDVLTTVAIALGSIAGVLAVTGAGYYAYKSGAAARLAQRGGLRGQPPAEAAEPTLLEEGAATELQSGAAEVTKDQQVQRWQRHAAQVAERWGEVGNTKRCLLTFGVVNLALFLEGYALHAEDDMYPYFALAKAGGYMMDVNFTLILFPVMRNLMSFLRLTPLAEIIPLDDHITFHKLVAMFGAAAALLHVAMHYKVMMLKADDGDGTVAEHAFGTLPGLTGHLILLMMLIMFVTAWEPVRRGTLKIGRLVVGGYNTFFKAHHLYIPCYVLLWIHSQAFHKWCFWPMMMFLVDKSIGHLRAGRKVTLVSAKPEAADVLRVEMDIKRFSYRPGQYLYLNCPQIAKHEWHPFTITSAPEENSVTVHIRTRGDWTGSLRKNLLNIHSKKHDEFVSIEAAPPPGANGGNPGTLCHMDKQLRVDGPYGSGSEHVFDYETAMLVGAGIGVTPFASIIKSIRLRSGHSSLRPNSPGGLPALSGPKHIYLYWVCRDNQEFKWFSPLLTEAQAVGSRGKGESGGPVFEINTYMTGELSLDAFAQDAELPGAGGQKWPGKKWAGRPNWRRIFKEMSEKHANKTIGVFLCGPGAKELGQQCKANSKGGVTFDFHKENF